MNKTFTISENYKKAQKKSIIWIIIFLITVLLSAIISLAIFLACIVIAIKIVSFNFMWLTVIIALGIGIMGGLVLYFNFKFIFNIFKPYESIGTEIYENDHPELFKLINKTAEEVGIKKPKKVYLTDQINASVSYSNQIQSLLFPTRKNLTIGIGLLHGVSTNELKGIIAHEFGHFSQKSMTIGSHVGNANRVIYDILYNNQSVKNVIDDLSSLNSIIGFISIGALGYTKVIEIILRKIYSKLDFNYLALSREMEYHADQIATNIVGIETMSKPLLRIELYDFSYNKLIEFYLRNHEDGKFTENVYQNLNQLIDLYIKNFNLEIENNLAIVDEYQFSQNHSKLQIDNLWTSHPEMEDRLANINSTNKHSELDNSPIAINLINNRSDFEESFSFDFFFQQNLYRTNQLNNDDFLEMYLKDIEAYSYPKVYNDFFDIYPYEFKNIKTNEASIYNENLNYTDLFSDENIANVKQLMALKNDIETLKELSNQKLIKQYKYEGILYKANDIVKVSEEINKSIKEKEELVEALILKINQFFEENLNEEKISLLIDCKDIETKLQNNLQLIKDIRKHLEFAYKPLHQQLRKEALIKLNDQVEEIQFAIKSIVKFEDLNKYMTKSTIKDAENYIRAEPVFYLEDGYNQNQFQYLYENIHFVEQASTLLLFDTNYKILKSYANLIEIENKKATVSL